MISLVRVKTHGDTPTYEITGGAGNLTYNPRTGTLTADGNLPAAATARRNATDCRKALRGLGDAGLWECMERIYDRAAGR